MIALAPSLPHGPHPETGHCQEALSCQESPSTDWQRRVAHAFSRAAPRYRELARAQAIMADMLLPHLPSSAQQVLDVGCGPGDLTRVLSHRYPQASLTGLDLSAAMLVEARRYTPAPFSERIQWLCGDAQQLPLEAGSQDLVVSNLAIQWCPDLKQTLQEIRRVTKAGGKAVINTLAPGTLQEIQQAWSPSAADGSTGDTGVLAFHLRQTHIEAAYAAGWAQVTVNQQRQRFFYPDLKDVMDSIKGVGAQVPRQGAHLTRRDIATARARYERLRQPEGLPVSYELLTLVLHA
uniref:malonyl-ACP O-methyltransferase BioC n=1 Tax=Halomonas sp. TaxID=1486246 RepID=UPI0026096E5B|nr:malonyl-ACP O-methyltransferase BioC [Halomonas sp.]